jgi:hypothetical protein
MYQHTLQVLVHSFNHSIIIPLYTHIYISLFLVCGLSWSVDRCSLNRVEKRMQLLVVLVVDLSLDLLLGEPRKVLHVPAGLELALDNV